MRKNNFLSQRKELTLEEMIKLGKITTKTFDRVSIVKSYIEKKYSLKTQKTDEKNKGKNIKH
jgi:stage III sporulation protein SpoIIIAA